MRAFVTGGTGYVGSHVVLHLLRTGHQVTILDDLSNSRLDVLDTLESLSGTRPDFLEGDVRSVADVTMGLESAMPDVIFHLAGRKSVAESVKSPLAYYDSNVGGTVAVLRAAHPSGVRTLVFSSSCTVYGSISGGLSEDAPRRPINAYGRSKAMVEDILSDVHRADSSWRIANLRYFNPVGGDESGLLGEAPEGLPANLLPIICRVAMQQGDPVVIFGDDYETPDGTALRDYVHVSDVAEAHLRALEYVVHRPGFHTWNLGTGTPVSVRQLIAAFERATGVSVPTTVGPRRRGDAPMAWAAVGRARDDLGWTARRSLEQMCRDAWAFETSRTGMGRDVS